MQICSRPQKNTQVLRQWRRSYVFGVNFEQVSHVAVFSLLTLKRLL